MVRALDVLLGRKGFKTSKLKTLLGLTTTRLVVLKNQRRSRCTHAEADIAQLLLLGNREQALDRAGYVIKEQNMFDLFVTVEGYCKFLSERASLLEHNKVCPDELKGAISSLIYVSSRTNELPELQDMRSMFAARFGQAFVSAATEVRNGCAVDDQIIQKASIRLDLEAKLKVVRAIAAEKSIPFDPGATSSSETISVIAEEEVTTNKSQSPPTLGSSSPSSVYSQNPSELYYWKENLSESMKMDCRFKDATSAAQAAFESAAFAAAAARAAVDLSRSESHGKGSGNQTITSNEINQHATTGTSELQTRAHRGKDKIACGFDDESLDSEFNQYELRRAKPIDGMEHGIQFQTELQSEEESEEDLIRRRPKASLDVLQKEKPANGVSIADGNENFRFYVNDSPKNAEARPRLMHSPAGSSFSVRTRRAGVRL